MVEVLGIDVAEDLLDQWRGWFAPVEQPFRIGSLPPELRADLSEFPDATVISAEVRDTFFVYSPGWKLLAREQFHQLPSQVRRALAAGRPRKLGRVLWAEDLLRLGDGPVLRYVETGAAASRHREVPLATWSAAERVVPQVQSLAGTFPDGSGPNCFGTVMAAAGVSDAAQEWIFQEPFEEWLAAETVPVVGRGHDQEPGTVLVWRDAAGLAQHAAVTVGDGWAFSKPSQTWCSPRLVWDVRTTVLRGRAPGVRLYRYRLHR